MDSYLYGDDGNDMIIGYDGYNEAWDSEGNDTYVLNPFAERELVIHGGSPTDVLKIGDQVVSGQFGLQIYDGDNGEPGGGGARHKMAPNIVIDDFPISLAGETSGTLLLRLVDPTEKYGHDLNAFNKPILVIEDWEQGDFGFTVEYFVEWSLAHPEDADGVPPEEIYDYLDPVTNTSATPPAGLSGSAADSTVNGGAGDDYLPGGGGSDTLNGNGGRDILRGEVGLDAMNGGAGADTLDGGTDNDTLSGGSEHDSLMGGAGADSLDGGSEHDTLMGGEGNDTLTGGTGTDTASFTGGAAVTVNLSTGAASGQGTDTLSGIENVLGSANADSITGDSSANSLEGKDGADSLDGGDGNDSLIGGNGNDTLTGGSGTDWAAFFGSDAAVTVNLSTGAASGQGTDTLSGIEHVLGSANADSITGDSSANTLDGGEGNDTLDGGSGNDTLTGSSGTDWASFATGGRSR